MYLILIRDELGDETQEIDIYRVVQIHVERNNPALAPASAIFQSIRLRWYFRGSGPSLLLARC